MKVIGVEQAIQKLDLFEKKVAGTILRKALRAGAKVTLAAAKAAVPSATGALKRAIKVRSGKRKKGQTTVLVSASKKWFKGPAFYGAFVEYGHKAGPRRLGGNRVSVPGAHFMEKAFESSKGDCAQTVTDTVARLVAEESK